MNNFFLNTYMAVGSKVNCLEGKEDANLCDPGLPVIGANSANVQTLLAVLFGVLAVICVIMITLGGIRFITESTNPQETAKARNTIIYAAIGLAIAISAQVIVAFVLNRAS